MKELLIKHDLITEADLCTKFKVEVYVASVSGSVPFMTVKYDGERFSISNYQLKKMLHSVTELKVIR